MALFKIFSVFLNSAHFLSLKHHATLPYNIADLTQIYYTPSFILKKPSSIQNFSTFLKSHSSNFCSCHYCHFIMTIASQVITHFQDNDFDSFYIFIQFFHGHLNYRHLRSFTDKAFSQSFAILNPALLGTPLVLSK